MVRSTKSIRGVVSLFLVVAVLSIGLPATSSATGFTYPCNSGTYTIVSGVVSNGVSCTGTFTIDSSATSIGSAAFQGASGIVSVTIPSSVTSIGRGAFAYLESTSFTIDSGNSNYSSEGGVIFNKLKTQLIQYPAGNTSASYTIPNSVTSIGDSAFLGAMSLTTLSIPNSVTSIGDYAFYFAEYLTTLSIPNSVISIGNYAFGAMTSLTTLSIPNSVISIGEFAFTDAISLTTLSISSSVTSIGREAFAYASSLTTLSIPNSVISIGNYAFVGATSLTTLSIPNSVTSIGTEAFSTLTSLTTLSIPSSVTSIGNYAFAGATSLTTLSIPNSVTSIGSYAFAGTTSLTQYTYCGTTLTQTQLNTAGLNGKTRISDCSSTHSPLFSSVSSYDGRVTAQIANYDSAFTYSATSSVGQASVNSSGLVTVTGLRPDQSVTVTVTVTRSGYASLTGSITGRSQVAPMLPGTKPTVTISDTLITCTIGSYSATPTSSAFSLFVDGKHISTIFSALGEYLPDWIIPWATSSTITRTAALTSATWTMSDAHKGKAITCATLAYSKNAIGFTASAPLTAR
jgi:acetyltransferase-like isoleucine patch superfamily enzyme